MDKASDFGSEDCRFESCHGRFLHATDTMWSMSELDDDDDEHDDDDDPSREGRVTLTRIWCNVSLNATRLELGSLDT